MKTNWILIEKIQENEEKVIFAFSLLLKRFSFDKWQSSARTRVCIGGRVYLGVIVCQGGLHGRVMNDLSLS